MHQIVSRTRRSEAAPLIRYRSKLGLCLERSGSSPGQV